MGLHGINAKRWFYGFRDYLRQHEERARIVLGGSACEQWLNAEFCYYIATSLPQTMSIYPELQKKDISVIEVNDGKTNWNPLAVIESKVVYSAYSKMTRDRYINRLLAQVTDAAKISSGPACYGFLFAVYAYWNHKKVKLSHNDFRLSVNQSLETSTTALGYRRAKPCIEEILSPAERNIGGAKVTVGLFGQYVGIDPEAHREDGRDGGAASSSALLV